MPSSTIPPVASTVPSASASAAPSANAGPAASTTVGAEPGEVKLGDQVVCVIRAPRGEQSAEARAQAASKALKEALEETSADDVRVETSSDLAVVFAGKIPIIELGPEDARLAGEQRVSVYAQAVAAKLREAIRAQKERSAILWKVFWLALSVLLSLVALYAMRKVGELSRRARRWLDEHAERVPAVRLRSIEVVRPQTLRSGLLAASGVGKWVLQFVVLYLWLLMVLWVLAPTSGYSARMTKFMFGPLSELTGRIVGALPLLLVAAVAGIGVFILVRFVGLFFDGVARGETELAWLPRELAPPTSLLLRAAIVVGALFFAAPIVTGDPAGALTRLGAVVLAVVGLGCTPLATSGVVGALLLYTRRLTVGDFVEFGGERGRLLALGLFEARLLAADGHDVRVPYLVALWRPTRIMGPRATVSVRLSVASDTSQSKVLELLSACASRHGTEPRVALLEADADGVEYRVSVSSESPDTEHTLLVALLDTLAEARIRLGRTPGTGSR